MNERITFVINSYGLTQGEFADRLGVQRSSISHIVSGRNKPSVDFLQKFMQAFPEIDMDWLLSGKGNYLKNEPKEANVVNNPIQTDIFENAKQLESQEPSKSSETKNEANLIKCILIYDNGEAQVFTVR